jgi:hypothetical protein
VIRAHRLIPASGHVVLIDPPTLYPPRTTRRGIAARDDAPLGGVLLCTGERVDLRAVPGNPWAEGPRRTGALPDRRPVPAPCRVCTERAGQIRAGVDVQIPEHPPGAPSVLPA